MRTSHPNGTTNNNYNNYAAAVVGSNNNNNVNANSTRNNNNIMTIGATVDSTLLSDHHGRQRREQRNIDKIDLQRARRYGMKEPSRYGREKYTYGGVVFIYDPKTCKEVTCFPSPDLSSELSGTKCTKPVILEKQIEYESQEWKTFHKNLRNVLFQAKQDWTSHSVLVIDMSGSMRKDDVNGARCRSDAVWLTVARDFVMKQLQTKQATHFDLVSVIIMQEKSRVILSCEPMDWVLYNMLLDKREWTQLRPKGEGNYLPAITLAEQMFNMNPLGSCSLSLLFFSDGKPSDFCSYEDWKNNARNHKKQQQEKTKKNGNNNDGDKNSKDNNNNNNDQKNTNNKIKNNKTNNNNNNNKSDNQNNDNEIDNNNNDKSDNHTQEFANRIGTLASKHGRRLTVCCIGIANQEEDFSTLEQMALEAKSFGSTASFHKPAMHMDSISSILSTFVTSLTTSKTEMTDYKTKRQLSVKPNLIREKKDTPDDLELTNEWIAFQNSSYDQYVRRVWKWNVKQNDFICFMDPRCIYCYAMVGDPTSYRHPHKQTKQQQQFQKKKKKKNTFHRRKTPGMLCANCKACFICSNCCTDGKYLQHFNSPECQQYYQERMTKGLLKKSVPSYSMAMKIPIFGEGAERIVHKFRYLNDANNTSTSINADKTFVGPKMVAKQSRFIEIIHNNSNQKNKKNKQAKNNNQDNNNHNNNNNATTTTTKDIYYQTTMDYHRKFMMTQAIASRFAYQFNKALTNLVHHFGQDYAPWIQKLPRIQFLEPMVIEVVIAGKENNILIEPMLEGNYTKFNNNMGYISDKDVADYTTIRATKKGGFYDTGERDNNNATNNNNNNNNALDAIVEEDEEEDTESEDDDDEHTKGGGDDDDDKFKLMDPNHQTSPQYGHVYNNVRDEDFPQAFSHFTYEKSRERLLVVDLQGVLQINESDQTRCYRLTDPAIHRSRRRNQHRHHGKKQQQQQQQPADSSLQNNNQSNDDSQQQQQQQQLSSLDHLDLGRTDRGQKGIDGFFKTHVCSDACRLLGLTMPVIYTDTANDNNNINNDNET